MRKLLIFLGVLLAAHVALLLVRPGDRYFGLRASAHADRSVRPASG